jgi:hypothetical protein
LFNSGFTLFSDEEFFNGFIKVCKLNESNEKVIYLKDVKNYLHYSFGFTPLDDEVNRNLRLK